MCFSKNSDVGYVKNTNTSVPARSEHIPYIRTDGHPSHIRAVTESAVRQTICNTYGDPGQVLRQKAPEEETTTVI
jgi:hypothetical protein